MNYFKNNRWVFWSIGLLIVLNLFTLGMLWTQNSKQEAGRPDKARMEKMKERKEKGRMSKVLNLSEEQAAQFKKLKESHREEMKARFEQIREMKKSKLDALAAVPYDSTLVNNLDSEIGQLHTQMEQSLSAHYQELSALCNAEQKEKLKGIFKRIFERDRRSGRRGHK